MPRAAIAASVHYRLAVSLCEVALGSIPRGISTGSGLRNRRSPATPLVGVTSRAARRPWLARPAQARAIPDDAHSTRFKRNYNAGHHPRSHDAPVAPGHRNSKDTPVTYSIPRPRAALHLGISICATLLLLVPIVDAVEARPRIADAPAMKVAQTSEESGQICEWRKVGPAHHNTNSRATRFCRPEPKTALAERAPVQPGEAKRN